MSVGKASAPEERLAAAKAGLFFLDKSRPQAALLWHTETMARGWESKSVEEQKDLADSRQPQSSVARMTPEQRQRLRERESLELARSRVQRELAATVHPRRRESLEAALRHLEEEIARLG